MTEARTADLWLKIDQLHLRFLQVVLNSQGVFWHKLSYFNTCHTQFVLLRCVFDGNIMQAEETPAKLELRNKLEGKSQPQYSRLDVLLWRILQRILGWPPSLAVFGSNNHFEYLMLSSLPYQV